MAVRDPSVTADVSALYRRLSEGATLRPIDAAEHGPLARPDAVLASLLDLNGTVRLADHLASRRKRPRSGPEAVPSPLRAGLQKKIDEILDEARTIFAEPFVGRRPMPNAETVLRALKQHDALATREDAALREAARMLHAQVRERFDHQLAKGRQRIRWMRTDVAGDLRVLGPEAAAAEAFDAVLQRGLDVGLLRLQQDVSARLDDVFGARLAAGVRALPPDAASIDSFYGAHGTMRRHAHDLRDLLVVTLEQEIDALLALVDTAFALRNQESLA